ncbi:L-xylulose/3-keto-L-gulonate kinase [Bacillus sp. JCM 19045]|nr:L-xylulose/3-keto-L-gulonate kinase [Bacillus sp. JCM 19045]
MYDATAFIFMVKDYVRFKLSGEAYLEITDVSGTSLLNVRDRCYDSDLLAYFGIAEVMEKLPPLKESTDVCGYLSKEAAEATGLTVGTPIAGGIFDISASAVASGLVEEGTLCIVAGTWSINEFITKKPVVDHALFMTSIYCLPDYWLTTEASPTSASNLEWFIDQFMELEKREAEAGGRSVYELCNEMVAQTTPEESDLLFFPFLFGSNTVAHANAGFIGMNSWHQKKHVVRAVYEGIVFSHVVHIERLLRYGEKPKRCRIAGGVTKSAVWVQMFADCLKLPIEIVEVNEHGTLGTAMCAAVMQGYYSSMKDAAEAMVQVGRTIVPNQEQSSIYATKFQRYKDRLKQMEPIWKAGV